MSMFSQIALAKASLMQMLKNKPVSLNVDQDKYLKTLRNAIREMILEKNITPYKNDTSLTFQEVKDTLNNASNPQVFSSAIEDSGDISQEVIDDLLADYSNLIGYMSNILPVNSSETLFGIDDKDPSKFEQDKFMRAVNVINNPLVVLDLFKANMLSPLEVEVIAAVYPDLYAEMQRFMIESLVDISSKITKPDLGIDKTRQVSILLGVNRLTPTKLREMQALYSEEKESSDIDIASINDSETQRLSGRKA